MDKITKGENSGDSCKCNGSEWLSLALFVKWIIQSCFVLQNVRISFEALRSCFTKLFTAEFVPVIRQMQRKKQVHWKYNWHPFANMSHLAK